MSTAQGQHHRAAVSDAIERVFSGRFRAVGETSWTFARDSSLVASVTATLSGDWLTLRAAVARGWLHGCAVPACAWELVRENAQIEGPAKLVVTPTADCVTRCVEIPLFEDDNGGGDGLPDRLAFACASLEDAAPSLGERRRRRRHRVPRDAGSREVSHALADLVRRAGWVGTARSEERYSVPLDTAPMPCGALVERVGDGNGNGSIRVLMSIPIGGELAEVSQRAIGTLLLKAGGLYRTVRGSVRDADDGPTGALEVWLPNSPRPEELNHALAALSVAARHCSAEVAAMCNPHLAREWCRRQQWPLPARGITGQHGFQEHEGSSLCQQQH